MTERPSVDRLLAASAAGDSEAGVHLSRLVARELRDMAARFLADQRTGHTLQPTALVNEAWIRMAKGGAPEGRAAFLAVAAAAMRSILVDHARRRNADKRGGGARPVDLDRAADVATDDDGAAMLAMHDVLTRLAATEPDAARVAEMRVFGGMEQAEIAVVLGASTRTVDRHWKVARARLEVLFGEADRT